MGYFFGKYEATFDEYDAFCEAIGGNTTGYKEKLIQAYETYLERSERPSAILKGIAKTRLQG